MAVGPHPNCWPLKTLSFPLSDSTTGTCYVRILPLLPLPTGSSRCAAQIAFREFSEDEYRKFVQTLSDEELVKAGKRLRFLSGNGKIVTTMLCAFYEQLKICREEYRRRPPKS